MTTLFNLSAMRSEAGRTERDDSLDNISNNRSHERIGDSRVSEELSTVVEDEVDLSITAGSERVAGDGRETERTPVSCWRD